MISSHTDWAHRRIASDTGQAYGQGAIYVCTTGQAHGLKEGVFMDISVVGTFGSVQFSLVQFRLIRWIAYIAVAILAQTY